MLNVIEEKCSVKVKNAFNWKRIDISDGSTVEFLVSNIRLFIGRL